MPDLFTLPELVTYMQVPSLPTDIATLARDLATIEIRRVAGPVRYDALTDVSALKGIALAVAKRVVFNPENLRSEKIDDYEYTISAESLGEAELTDREEARLHKILGRSAAFSVRTSYPARNCRTRVCTCGNCDTYCDRPNNVG